MRGQVSSTATGPQRAVVVPRACLLPDGEALPIEQIVRSLLNKSKRGIVVLDAPPGGGLTTALSHLSATFAGDSRVEVIDEHETPPDYDERCRSWLAITASRVPFARRLATIQLRPWVEDDLIEYLLAMHPQRVASVVSRVRADENPGITCGAPQLWRLVLDEMAADDSIHYVTSALRRSVLSELECARCTERALQFCLSRCLNKRSATPGPVEVQRLLRYPAVQLLLGAERLAQLLEESNDADELEQMKSCVLEEVALLVRSRPLALERLSEHVRRRRHTSRAAGVLITADPYWRPADADSLDLSGATLSGACWASLNLSHATLTQANLNRADLSDAYLRGAMAAHVKLRQACLRNANLCDVFAQHADFAGAELVEAVLDRIRAEDANFQRADLTGASLQHAVLARVNFERANLRRAAFNNAAIGVTGFDHTDLTEADFGEACLRNVTFCDAILASTSFVKSRLNGCDFEDVVFEHANFRQARLHDCLLTGSQMSHANFERASLSRCGLAYVEWEGANLRGADLRGATFHLGSSRSGLVGSTLPCEGSRTGFYRDDPVEHDYKPPEEIRTSNLRNADLRGAEIEGVDFHLVDLRGAKLTPEQLEHCRECGAIL